jgi:Ca2+-binding EF-hand superfamily protein
MKKILAVALVFSMFMPLMTGGAQEKKGKTPEERFAALDKNNDKKLSKEEYLAQYTDETKKEKAGTRFDRMDKNGDKSLSLEEYKEGTMKKN